MVKLSLKTGTDVKYLIQDHLGSTTALSDSTGAVTAAQTYDSFGNGTNANFPTRYQYTDREFDAFSKLYYYRARFYDPKLGRFISEDPIGFAGGDVNLYGYVRNMPLWYRDPRGLQPGADVMRDPNILRATVAAAGAVIAAVPAAPVVVAAAGAAAIYGATYVGSYTASHPSNPFVNGPLNPFGTPYPGVRPLPPTITTSTTSRPYCQPVPRSIPFARTPAIPIPRPTPDREGCAQEWADAFEYCANNMGKPDKRPFTGGYTNLHDCARGLVSQRCGGNRVE